MKAAILLRICESAIPLAKQELTLTALPDKHSHEADNLQLFLWEPTVSCYGDSEGLLHMLSHSTTLPKESYHVLWEESYY